MFRVAMLLTLKERDGWDRGRAVAEERKQRGRKAGPLLARRAREPVNWNNGKSSERGRETPMSSCLFLKTRAEAEHIRRNSFKQWATLASKWKEGRKGGREGGRQRGRDIKKERISLFKNHSYLKQLSGALAVFHNAEISVWQLDRLADFQENRAVICLPPGCSLPRIGRSYKM